MPPGIFVEPAGRSNVVRTKRVLDVDAAGARSGAVAEGTLPVGEGKSPYTGAPLCSLWNAIVREAAMKTSAIATASTRVHRRDLMATTGFAGARAASSRVCRFALWNAVFRYLFAPCQLALAFA